MSFTLDEMLKDPSLIFKAQKIRTDKPLQVTDIEVKHFQIAEGHYLCELHHLTDPMNPNCDKLATIEYRIDVPSEKIQDNMFVCYQHHRLMIDNTRPNAARIKARKDWQRRKGIGTYIHGKYVK